MEVSPAKSLILSATIHGGSYFFIQPKNATTKTPDKKISLSRFFNAAQGDSVDIRNSLHDTLYFTRFFFRSSTISL